MGASLYTCHVAIQCIKYDYICITTEFQKKICISFTYVDVIYHCLYLNFHNLIRCNTMCLETPRALPVTLVYCKSLKSR